MLTGQGFPENIRLGQWRIKFGHAGTGALYLRWYIAEFSAGHDLL